MLVRDYPSYYQLLADRPADPLEFYDRLVPAASPRQGLPADVNVQGRLAIWVDVHVPADAKAGRYALNLELAGQAVGGGAVSGQMTVELEVLDLVLAENHPTLAVGAFDHRALFGGMLTRDGQPFVPQWLDRADPMVVRGLVFMRQLMTLAHDHHLDLFDAALEPALKRDDAGRIKLDWEEYDAIARPYLDGTAFSNRVACSLWPAPLSETWPQPAHYGGLGSMTYNETAGEISRQIVQHFDAIAASGQLFFWPVRNSRDSLGGLRTSEMAAVIRTSAHARRFCGRFPRVSCLAPHPLLPRRRLRYGLPRQLFRLPRPRWWI